MFDKKTNKNQEKTEKTKIIEINKSEENEELKEKSKKLVEKLEEKLNKLEFVDESLKSVLVAIVYDYEVYNIKKETNHIRYIKPKEFKVSAEQDIKIESFRNRLDKIQNTHLQNGQLAGIPTQLLVFYNHTEEQAKKKIEEAKNPSKGSNPILNVQAVRPKYRMDQVILNEEIKEELQKVLTMVRNIDKIYNEWGFIEVDATPKCIINFYGEPGTGKTMSAHAIAQELGKKIHAFNYSDIESKFVGDAPKNLVAAFESARKANSVLFFDEADSFLGKRITNVSSSSDQAVNSLRSQMLILLENHEGVVLFATNLHENYDSAFESRILRHVKFELPDQKMRSEIILKMIPKKAPIDSNILIAEVPKEKSEIKETKNLQTDESKKEENQTERLVDQLSGIIDGFSPREIKNTILDVLITSIQKDCEINQDFLIEMFEKSKKKFDEMDPKKKLGKDIKKHLKDGNYKVVRNEKKRRKGKKTK